MLHLLPAPAPPAADALVAPSDLRGLGVLLLSARSAAAHARSTEPHDPVQAARDRAYVTAAIDAARVTAPPAIAALLTSSPDAALAALGVLLDPFAPGGWTLTTGDRCSILEVADVVRSSRADGTDVRLVADWLALAAVSSDAAYGARRHVSDGLAALKRRRPGRALDVTLRRSGADVVVDVALRVGDRQERVGRRVAA